MSSTRLLPQATTIVSLEPTTNDPTLFDSPVLGEIKAHSQHAGPTCDGNVPMIPSQLPSTSFWTFLAKRIATKPEICFFEVFSASGACELV
jgi:hypothetical protein